MSKVVSHTREQHRDMILHPLKWPALVLPLTRHNPFDPGNCAVFSPPMGVHSVAADEPIEIRIGTMFQKMSELPRKQYENVDALLDDGWTVD